MAVAVKNTPESKTGNDLEPSPLAGFLGAAYVLVSLAIVFYGLPKLWEAALTPVVSSFLSVFFDKALLLVAMVAAAVGLLVGGVQLAGGQLHKGFRASVFFGVIGLVGSVLIAQAIGYGLEQGGMSTGIGVPLTAIVLGGLLFGLTRLYFLPAFAKLCSDVEDQGWFHATAYKRSQGQRVRRGTMAGVLLLAGCGIYTLLVHKTLEAGAADWSVYLPFSDAYGQRIMIPLLPDLKFTIPILLTVFTLWFAYRVVNYPTFADFLIATEAEINKVSWTTRRRLFQDTVVVLTTVFLMTLFIFLVDVLWGWGLTKIGVLQLPDAQELRSQQKEIED